MAALLTVWSGILPWYCLKVVALAAVAARLINSQSCHSSGPSLGFDPNRAPAGPGISLPAQKCHTEVEQAELGTKGMVPSVYFSST